jgi:hypothetical protein
MVPERILPPGERYLEPSKLPITTWVTPQKCPFTLSVSRLNVSIAGCPLAQARFTEDRRTEGLRKEPCPVRHWFRRRLVKAAIVGASTSSGLGSLLRSQFITASSTARAFSSGDMVRPGKGTPASSEIRQCQQSSRVVNIGRIRIIVPEPVDCIIGSLLLLDRSQFAVWHWCSREVGQSRNSGRVNILGAGLVVTKPVHCPLNSPCLLLLRRHGTTFIYSVCHSIPPVYRGLTQSSHPLSPVHCFVSTASCRYSIHQRPFHLSGKSDN